MSAIREETMCNVLAGTAIGDALGVPFETMPFDHPELVAWEGYQFLGSDYHPLQPGQYSDDTQMSILVAESLIENKGFKPEDLAARYADWIGSGAARGYGKTTLLAVQNLHAGKSYRESGIAGAFGNGTAMRAAPFGVYFRADLNTLLEAVKIDSAITHVSEEAEAGALAIALASYYTCNRDTAGLLKKILFHIPDSAVKKTIEDLDSLLSSDMMPAQALRLLGTRADVRQTVPAALYCCMKFDSFHEAVVTAIKAGGDTDTTAAIVGAIFGARLGLAGISKKFYSVENFDKLVHLDSQLYNKH